MKSSKPRQVKQSKTNPGRLSLNAIIADAAEEYLSLVGLTKYHFSISYPAHDPSEEDGYGFSRKALASSTIDRKYLNVILSIYPVMKTAWEDGKIGPGDVKKIIAHEIAHVATNHLYSLSVEAFKSKEDVVDANEVLTTIMGRLIYDLSLKKNSANESSSPQKLP